MPTGRSVEVKDDGGATRIPDGALSRAYQGEKDDVPGGTCGGGVSPLRVGVEYEGPVTTEAVVHQWGVQGPSIPFLTTLLVVVRGPVPGDDRGVI